MFRAVILSLFTFAAVAGPALSGKVVGITDGDTLTLLVDRKQVKIRLAEIDAPEKGQAFGKRATQALARLTFQKPALVVVVDYDRYGRTVGRVFADRVDVSAEMVHRATPGPIGDTSGTRKSSRWKRKPAELGGACG